MSDRIPLYLFPGLLCDRALWLPQIEALSDIAEIYVADFTAQTSVAEMAADALAVGPDKFALAGLSMGGFIAMEAMRQAPDRILKLALFDTRARPDTEEEAARRRGFIELAKRGEFIGVARKTLPYFIHQDRMDDEALVNEVMAMTRRAGRDAYIRQQTALLSRADSRPSLPAVDVPTLVLCGRQDQLSPVEAHEEMAGLIPGATLEVIEDCGHLATMERPDQVNALMRDWLRG